MKLDSPLPSKSKSTRLNCSNLHPTVVVIGDVEIAEDVEVGPYCVLVGPLKIASGCKIGAGCVIGGEPDHRTLKATGPITIGTGTILKEYCVVHQGTDPRGTRIGSNCYIMNRVYIAHDCQLADDVVVSAGSSLAGHVKIHNGANLGMLVSVHQYSTIGAYSMIGMSTPVSKDVPPFCLAAGNPIHVLRVNQHALSKLGITDELITAEDFGLIYRQGNAIIDASLANFQTDSTRASLFEPRSVVGASPRKPR